MTKIKNTKKGMAKKTLSVSLAVAMLATSNVPVWAAEFSDGSEAVFTSEAPVEVEAPVIEETPVVDDTVVAPVAEAVEGYTVETNLTLKEVDWNTGLTLEAPKDETAKFVISNADGVETSWSKAEVYVGDSLFTGLDVADGNNLITRLQSVTYGRENYKNSKNVTVKVYVDGANAPVYVFQSVIQPVNINTLKSNLVIEDDEKVYTGSVQNPDIEFGITERVWVQTGRFPWNGYWDNRYTKITDEVVIEYNEVTEAKNVGSYSYKIRGVEADGYTGFIEDENFNFVITPAKPDATNLSVVISGSTTYNGSNAKPTVVVTDKLANVELPEELYDVTLKKTDVGSYDNSSDNLTITLKESATIDNKKVWNNFGEYSVATNDDETDDVTELATGSYVIGALDLSKLSDKYDVVVATKKVDEKVDKTDITFIDKATKKEYAYNDILPSGQTTITTTNNTAVGKGTVTITPYKVGDQNIINKFETTFDVVNATVTASDLSFPKGTVINGKALTTKTVITAADIFKTGDNTKKVLKDETYTGSAIEPLKEAFSNLVLTNSSTVEDQKLVLGTDYDLVYTDNTDSNAVSEKTPTVKLVFKGIYSGTVTFTFTINKATVDVKTPTETPYVAGKTSYDVVAEITTGTGTDKKDVPESEYTVTTRTKATGVGTKATGVVVFNNKNYSINSKTNTNTAGYDYKEITTTVVAKDIKNCTASIEGEYIYIGESISPKLVVKDGDIVLDEGKDYKVVSQNNINAGTALVTVKGLGNYQGTLTLEYAIKKANLADAKVISGKQDDKDNYDKTYTGVIVEPDISSVKIGNVTLKKYDPVEKTGDYVITYDEAIEVGTYNFTITALESSKNVEGEFKGTFKVNPLQLEGNFVQKLNHSVVANPATPLSTDVTGAYYTGKEITIDSFKTKYVVIDKDGKVLTEGKEYRLEYKNNIDSGIASVVAYGIGNYATTDKNGKAVEFARMNYYIEGKVIANSWVKKISDVEYAGGLPVEPEVVIYDENNNRLVQGKDFTVETTVTAIGDNYTQADVTIKGKGAYTTMDADNSKLSFVDYNRFGRPTYYTFNWKVTKKDLANTVVTVDGDKVTVMNGTVVVPDSEYDVKFSEDGSKVTVTAKEDSEKYTGSKEVIADSKPVGQAMISEVKVAGNKATVILSGEVDNASGYDYVIATEEDYKNGRVDISKNQVRTDTNFQYVQKGVYYAYCHAWKRGEDGKKVFGEWSNLYEFTVGTTTPAQPVITSVKASGSTVTVTYTQAADATGYDVVLGSSTAVVNREKRPVNYGTLVKKNIKGNVVTATFTNVPAGTYYAGLHAFNRTSIDNTKVFSPWSNIKTVTVK